MKPASIVSRLLMQRRNVDFPDPDGPRITTTSPAPTSRSIPRSTSWWPNDFRTPRARTSGVAMLTRLERQVDATRGRRGAVLLTARVIALDRALHDVQDRSHQQVPDDSHHQQRN